MNIERLREVFDYDHNSGVLSGKKRTSNRVKVGAAAAAVCPSGNGYLKVRLDYVLYYAHRVAYAVANGPIPDGAEIDHINGVRKAAEVEHQFHKNHGKKRG